MSEKLEFEIKVPKNELSEQLKKSSNDAKAVESSLDGVSESAKEVGVSIKKASSEAGFFKDTLKIAGGVFAGDILINAFSKIKTVILDAASEAINFKRELIAIETILPKNAKLTDDLVQSLRDLSVRFGTSASSQAKTYYDIISAGVEDATDATKLLQQANELATGGLADTAQTINLLTTIYNVYGKELATTSEAADSLFKTVQIGKTNIQELSADLGQALPIAKSFGITLDEVGAVLAQFTNAGITTSESVTLLNALLSAIAKNGEKLGPGFNSLAVQTDSLAVVLDRLKQRTNGSNDALFELLGRQEAVRAVQSLTSKGLENYNKVLADYSNKAGVAADASSKIIDNDIGKQFDIFSSGVRDAATSLVSLFIPAVNGALKATNDLLFSQQKFDSAGAERGLSKLRKEVEALDIQLKNGRISQDAYARSIGLINKEIALLSGSLDTAKNPLIALSTGLKAESDKIKSELFNLKNGFDILGQIQGPEAATQRVAQLEARLKEVNAQLTEINKPTPVSQIVTTPRGDEAIQAEKELRAQLLAVREQAILEQNFLDQQNAIATIEDLKARRDAELQSLLDFELAKNQIIFEQELAKNELIKDPINQRLANEKAAESLRLANAKAASKLQVQALQEEQKAKLALEQSFQASRGNLISQGFQLAATVAKDGSKAQFTIQKAAALAEIAIADGKARALIPAQTAAIPFPGNLAAAASLNAYVTAQTALGSAIVAASAIKGYATGGIVGASTGADTEFATVRKNEMVLNADDQKKLYDGIKSGGFGGGDIVIQIDGREIARAVRSQVESGFKLA